MEYQMPEWRLGMQPRFCLGLGPQKHSLGSKRCMHVSIDCSQRSQPKTYPSMTWTTPLETSTSGMVTFAELTNTEPSIMLMVMSAPLTVLRVVFVNMELYPTVP